jgi:DAACS family dicarboxylate/amino acid:cation (Na+ or H+) symporter
MSRTSAFRLQRWIFIGLVVGIVSGVSASFIWTPESTGGAGLRQIVDDWVRPVGTVFLRLLFMTVLPLIFSALALGAYGVGSLGEIGRMGARTLVATLVLSGISVMIGLGLVNAVRPGERIGVEARERFRSAAAETGDVDKAKLESARLGTTLSLGTLVNAIIPRNPVEAAAHAFDGDMLSVMFFAVLFGIALRACNARRVAPLVALLEGLYDVSIWLIGMALALAPLGVAALTFATTSVVGAEMLTALGFYVGTVIAGLGLQLFVVYPLTLRFFCGRSPRAFLAGSREVLMTAFSTSSSNATLPTTIRVAKGQLRIPSKVADFVLTLGSTFNQNGTALFEGVTILFLAQFYGVELDLGRQVLVVVLAILAGVGTAGVPGGSIPLLVPVLVSVGIPAEGVFVILGVDRILDMCRTTLNVAGDLVVAAYVGRGEAASAFVADGEPPGDTEGPT